MNFESRFVRDVPFAFPGVHDQNVPFNMARELKVRYAGADRHYHDLRHIFHCLDCLNAVRCEAIDIRALTAAIYYHDAIYVAGAADNEEMSAALAYQELKRLGYLESFRARVRDNILATKHDGKLTMPDEQIMADVDLSGLGASYTAFTTSVHKLRREYAVMSDEDFTQKTVAFYDKLLHRRNIYYSIPFRFLFEERAQENILRFKQEARFAMPRVA